MSTLELACPPGLAEPAARPIVPERAADQLDRLFGLALALCGSRPLAEDLVQEAYVRVLARPRLLRGGDEFSYLARIVRNLFYDHYRRSRRVEWVESFPEDEGPVDPSSDSDPEVVARTRELLALVAELPEPQREAVAAVDVAGMRYHEAARSLGVPIGTVMSRLSRGRSRLARALGEDTWE
jgi:RNA polymerase sigma-70 factor (ECF subfamily)